MADPRMKKLADILVNYSAAVRPGEWVLINGHVLALPLVNEVARLVLRAGGQPTVMLNSEQLEETILREASEEQLRWVSPIEALVDEKIDVTIGVRAAHNTRALSGVDPRKQQIRQSARRDSMRTFMQRSAAGSLRWVVTQLPCPAYAQDADMSLGEYEDFVYGATFADQPDPVACWNDIYTTQQRLVDWLKGKRQVVVRGPHIDLTLSIDGRTFINSDGKRNMPSGEIFTGPVEESVKGWVKFNYPAIRQGREVEGVELEFKDGKVVTAIPRPAAKISPASTGISSATCGRIARSLWMASCSIRMVSFRFRD
jgi:aminopeptidase